MSSLRLSLSLAVVACTMALSANAGLIGASVTGSLSFGGPTNYFDPTNGFVPVGYLNKTNGITVTIADPAIEFGYSDPGNTDTADFTDFTLTLIDASTGIGGGTATYTFTSAAFAGATLSPTGSDFPGAVISSLAGNTITITTPSFVGLSGISAQAGPTYTATFNIGISAVPEPQSIALVASGIGLCGFLARRRKARQ